MTLLSNAEIDLQLKSLDGWTRDGDAIRKQYTFKGFPDAVAFVTGWSPTPSVRITIRTSPSTIDA